MCARFSRARRKFVPRALIVPMVLGFSFGLPAAEAEEARTGRQVEEVIVTAERRESTVSDTSISITAFTGEFLEDFGIRNQEDLQNYIPAAVIEPYDMSIRGVGRNFRSLGGDPGVATYLNGVYSEDFGIASTEGGLFDVERIEVLRGPQGTLYGRNAIGGAVNFINKQPTEEFESEARILVGDYDLREYYGVVSGPIIEDFLQARVTATKRTRDGYFEDLGPADDAGNYGDENYALSLRLTPTDDIELNVRGNERSYARRMGGADAAGIVVFGENEGNVDFGNARDNTTYVFGYRAVDPAVPCPSLFARTAPVASTGVRGGIGCAVAAPTFTFTNPTTGTPVTAQRVVPGVDNAGQGSGTTDHPNRTFGHDLTNIRVLGFDDLEGSDLETETSGQQDEFFDQQAVSFDAVWQLSDMWSVKYIFGYTDYFYDRTTDTDLTDNPSFDNQFYVSQETEYASHELQIFFDPTERLSLTSGLFWYDAKINQRGDFYDSDCTIEVPNGGCNSRHAADFPYAAFGFTLGPKVDLFTSRMVGRSGAALPPTCLTLPDIDVYCFGNWEADTGDRIPHGPRTAATELEYATRSERRAYAAYSQGVYTFNEHWALTLGLRWARDELEGEENLFFYSESVAPLTADGPFTLATLNQLLGYLGPNGEILNPDRLLVAGFPASQSLWRALDRSDDEVTWRVNLDWTPTDDHLVYLSATKGHRAGGFNLVFFSTNEQYEPESLIAYELGYKGQIFEGTTQINSAIYYYDYEDVHTFAQGPGALDENDVSSSVFAVPGAEMIGWDTDVLWLATDRVTLGANFSYTHTEYTEDFFLIDSANPASPNSLFNAVDRPININGNQMSRVPERKGGAWGQYTWPLGANGRTEFLASWSWIDEVFFQPFEDPDDAAEAYSRLDLRATWFSQDESWTVAAFVNNVLDEVGIRQVERTGEEGNYLRAGVTTDPRLYGLEVRYKIGGFK